MIHKKKISDVIEQLVRIKALKIAQKLNLNEIFWLTMTEKSAIQTQKT